MKTILAIHKFVINARQEIYLHTCNMRLDALIDATKVAICAGPIACGEMCTLYMYHIDINASFQSQYYTTYENTFELLSL